MARLAHYSGMSLNSIFVIRLPSYHGQDVRLSGEHLSRETIDNLVVPSNSHFATSNIIDRNTSNTEEGWALTNN